MLAEKRSCLVLGWVLDSGEVMYFTILLHTILREDMGDKIISSFFGRYWTHVSFTAFLLRCISIQVK
jgi:hypothetical protein